MSWFEQEIFGTDLDLDTIYNEDCRDTMRRMPDESVDMVLTSPPYDDLREYEGYQFPFEWIAEELVRVLRDDGILVWVVGDATHEGSETGSSFQQALHFMELGLKLHDTMIFEKNSSTFPARKNGNRYTQIFEYMFVFAKGRVEAGLICDKPNKWAGHKDYSGKLKNPVPEFSPRTNIWRFVTSMNGVKHPAPFPEELARDHILTWSEPGAIVYDPFMGSGTTAKMAKMHDRHFIGSEISRSYWETAVSRVDGLV
jgi:site-specific DNA-methyltransferase (adenine-specific)